MYVHCITKAFFGLIYKNSIIRGMEAKRSKIIDLFRAKKSAGEILKILQSENVGRKLIYRTIQRYKETGSLKERARSGRPRNVRTRELKAKIRKRIVRNPRRSMRKMSRDFGISCRSIGRVVHDDLGLKSLKRRKVHMLTKAIREKRLQRSRGLLSRAGPDVVDRILFSDEKLFTILEVSNPQNDRIISSSVQDIPEHLRFIPRRQKPTSVMVWGGISANSWTNLIFVPTGVKINSKTYRELILDTEVKGFGCKNLETRVGPSSRMELQLSQLTPPNSGSENKKLTSFPKSNGHLPVRI